jgi:hypothetical protein
MDLITYLIELLFNITNSIFHLMDLITYLIELLFNITNSIFHLKEVEA